MKYVFAMIGGGMMVASSFIAGLAVGGSYVWQLKELAAYKKTEGNDSKED